MKTIITEEVAKMLKLSGIAPEVISENFEINELSPDLLGRAQRQASLQNRDTQAFKFGKAKDDANNKISADFKAAANAQFKDFVGQPMTFYYTNANQQTAMLAGSIKAFDAGETYVRINVLLEMGTMLSLLFSYQDQAQNSYDMVNGRELEMNGNPNWKFMGIDMLTGNILGKIAKIAFPETTLQGRFAFGTETRIEGKHFNGQKRTAQAPQSMNEHTESFNRLSGLL